MNAAEVIQILLLLDQTAAAALRLITEGKAVFTSEDEKALQEQLKVLRQRNDERFAAVEAMLKARAAG